MLLFPFVIIALQIPIFVYFLTGFALIGTANLELAHFIGGAQSLITASSSYADSLNVTLSLNLSAVDIPAQYEQWVGPAIYIYFLFGILWLLESLKNIGWTSLSGNVSDWYFFRRDKQRQSRIPLTRSFCRVLRYHLGTIFFGSFIIALIQLIRILMAILDSQTKKLQVREAASCELSSSSSPRHHYLFSSAHNHHRLSPPLLTTASHHLSSALLPPPPQEKNNTLKLAMKAVQCCLWCLEKTVKFITDYCYIYVAMQGGGFCRSCFAVFTLILSQPAQLALNTAVRLILSLLQLIAIPVTCSWACNYYLTQEQKAEPMYASVVVALMSFIIVQAFALVMSCTLDTLFVCCVRDKSEYKGAFMSDRLYGAFGFDKSDRREKRAAKKAEKAEGGGGKEKEEAKAE